MYLLPQSSTPLAPLITVRVPCGQLRHFLFRCSDEKVPVGQVKHLAMPVEEYDPGPHSSEMINTIRSLF